jgi:hypothetical protein
MNAPEPENSSASKSRAPGTSSKVWSEEAVERLLRGFYPGEMPAELRLSADEQTTLRFTASKQPAESSRPAGAGSFRLIGSGLTAVCVLAAVVWFAGQPDTTDTRSDSQAGGGAIELPRNLADRRDGDRRTTGPVESRDALRPVAIDPDGFGAGADEVTEWDIEVFPIDDPTPMSPGAPTSPAVAEPAPHRFE